MYNTREQDKQIETAFLMALSKSPAKWSGIHGPDQVVCGGKLYDSSMLESLLKRGHVIPMGTRTYVLNPNR